MGSFFKELLVSWSIEKNQRLKMQQAYFGLVIALAFLSGVGSLFSVSFGRNAIMLGALIATLYLLNAVAWTIFDMIVSRKIDQWLKSSPRSKR